MTEEELKEKMKKDLDEVLNVKSIIDFQFDLVQKAYLKGLEIVFKANETTKELEQENKELKDKLNNLSSVAAVRLANWQKYEKENAELKTKVTALENANKAMVKELDAMTSGGLGVLENVVRSKEQLAEAKEIIQEYIRINLLPPIERNFDDEVKLFKQAEQFLSKVGK